MSAPQWVADIAIDARLAAQLVHAQFDDLDIGTVVPFGNGWDNSAFLIDGFVFRFPRRAAFAHLIAREIALLPAIAPLVPWPISAPTRVGTPTERYPYPFAGYPLVAGRTACAVALNADQRSALAAPLGLFLRSLHGIPTGPLVERGLPEDELGRLDHPKRSAMTRERCAALSSSGVLDGADRFTAWLDAHPPHPPQSDALRVVHGDLYPRHLIIDAAHRAAGVIDWGDVHLGDVALDLGIAHHVLPADAHAAFIAAYGPIDDRTWNAARYRAIYHAVLEVEYGVKSGDAAMRDIGLTALRLIEPQIAGQREG